MSKPTASSQTGSRQTGSRQAARRRGLPGDVAMRHAHHFVDDLTTRDAAPIGRMLPLAAIRPDPAQPRKRVGDLSELVASIREKGVLEPILVRIPTAGETDREYMIISGERRYRAALEVGLYDIPAIEMDVGEQEALEIALVENLQRQDLTAFEEAEGYRVLAAVHSYTHEEIALAVGKSRPSVSESLSLLHMPDEVRRSVSALGIESKSVLLELLKLHDRVKMVHVVGKIASLGWGREAVRREVKRLRQGGRKRTRAKAYTFQFRAPDKRYQLSVRFRQTTIEPEDLILALEETLSELKRQHRREGGDPLAE